ncbi:MAG: HepT-like ribonuclease domain-containing protein [Bacteroidota bacterium]
MQEIELLKIKTLHEAINKIQKFTEDMSSVHDMTSNDLVWDAVKMNLVVIAEMDMKISQEIKEIHHTVDWHKIQESKPNIISQYLGFDPDEVWKAIQEKMPDFKKQLEEVLN